MLLDLAEPPEWLLPGFSSFCSSLVHLADGRLPTPPRIAAPARWHRSQKPAGCLLWLELGWDLVAFLNVATLLSMPGTVWPLTASEVEKPGVVCQRIERVDFVFRRLATAR